MFLKIKSWQVHVSFLVFSARKSNFQKKQFDENKKNNNNNNKMKSKVEGEFPYQLSLVFSNTVSSSL